MILSWTVKRDPLSHLLLAVGALLRCTLTLIGLGFRSRSALMAENPFLRKRLALYLERKVRHRQASDATRLTLVALTHLFAWRGALTVVQPDTLIDGVAKAFGYSGDGNRSPEDDLESLPESRNSSL